MIRRCEANDFDTIRRTVNEAAIAYKGVIPTDRWQEPYMPEAYLHKEMEAGVIFWALEENGEIAGVMGIQDMADVTLIRHAYTLPHWQRQGVGGRLLTFLCCKTVKPTLIGTWAAAFWAVRFYEKYGFSRVTAAEKDFLLRKYWDIPERQVETSVVLSNRPVDDLTR